jgi:nucleoside-diphosphate-sugar epimerase
MRILGRGLLARSFAPYADRHPSAVVFAQGVADSATTDEAAYAREIRTLEQALADARVAGGPLVYFSGGGALYGGIDPCAEDGPVRPTSAYGRHQLACEADIAGSGVPFLVLRLPNVVGSPANPGQLVPSLVRQSLDGRVRVQRRAERDLIDVADVAALAVELLDLGCRDTIVNVASGHSVPVLEVVDAIRGILRVTPTLDVRDAGAAQRFDTSRLRGLLGRDPFPDAGYYRDVLARHVPALAATLR